MEFNFRNVNDAFSQLVDRVYLGSRTDGPFMVGIPVSRRPSRYGDTLTIEEPVLITYAHPVERVLFNKERDANCFFHLYESLWMLAGRNDVASLEFYNSRMKEFSDDGRTFNGAYGYRWRHANRSSGAPSDYYERQVDQLDFIVNHLKAHPTSRRAVLQMWNVEDDLLKVGYTYCPKCKGSSTCDTCDGSGVLDMGSKDVCCNLSAMFSLRPLGNVGGHPEASRLWGKDGYFLDMTVINRSNDMVWGLLGANYVQFTVLQEYMAARLGAEVGRYHHFTNNLHTYLNNWFPEKWLGGEVVEGYPTSIPLVKNPDVFEAELPRFVEHHSSAFRRRHLNDYTEPFLRDVAHPMCQAFHYRKDDPDETAKWLGRIAADDWRLAATNWIQRRRKAVVADG